MPRIPLLRNPSRALTPVKMDRERWIVLEPLAFCLLFLCLSRGWLLRSETDLIWFLAVITLEVDVYAISVFIRTRENKKTKREEYFRAIYNKIDSSGWIKIMREIS